MHFVELTPLLLTKKSNYVLPARSNRIEAEFGKCWGSSSGKSLFGAEKVINKVELQRLKLYSQLGIENVEQKYTN